MEPEEIRFGMRRYALMMALFVGGGIGFVWWSRGVDQPMFVFPFGLLDADTARVVLLIVGALALLYAGVLSYVRFVKRPVVALHEDSISIPVGEFARRVVTLRAGDVLTIEEGGRRAGGWRTCRVRHRGGELAVRSSQLPSDEAYDRVSARLRALAKIRRGPA